ncbi:hypothetical protein ACX80N_17020 [Arthrobacter sp. MDT2-16]
MSVSSMAQDSALRLGPAARTMAEVIDRALEGALEAPDQPITPADKTQAKQAGHAEAQSAISSVSSGPLAQLTKFVPTETITLYVAVLAALGDVTPPTGNPISDADFTAHWAAVVILLGVTVALTLGLSYRAQKDRSADDKFQVPYFEVCAAGAAFVIWALSLPTTPLRDVPGYDYSAWSSVLILVGTLAIGTTAFVLKKNVKWDKIPAA